MLRAPAGRPHGAPAALLACAVIACGEGAPRDPPEDPTLTVAVRADVTGLFPGPPMADEAYTYEVNWNVFEGLVRFGPRLEPVPALAHHWENPDDRTYVFDLHPALRFSDGKPVTAGDVVASLEAARDRGWVNGHYLQAIEGVRAVGHARVEIRTRFPYVVLLSKLPWGMVVPRAALRGEGPFVGTGPYAVARWDPGRELVLARNPHFRGAPAPFGRVRLLVRPDAEERMAALRSGEAQVVDQVPLESLEELRARPDVQVFAGPGLRVVYLALRVDRPPFSDPRVREALDLAIDRQELIRRAYDGRTVEATQLVPPAVVGYDPSLAAPRLPDRARARKLLSAAGHARGLRVRLDGPNNRYVRDRAILDELARQLGEVGVQATVNALDKRDFFPMAFGGRSDLHLLGWECQSGEAGQALDAVMHSRRDPGLGGANSSGVADAELDDLIEAANRAVDPRVRVEALQRALARVGRLRPVLPLLVQAEAVAIRRTVHWQPDPRFSLRLADMRPAGIPADRP